jgi:hypothetical protein
MLERQSPLLASSIPRLKSEAVVEAVRHSGLNKPNPLEDDHLRIQEKFHEAWTHLESLGSAPPLFFLFPVEVAIAALQTLPRSLFFPFRVDMAETAISILFQ